MDPEQMNMNSNGPKSNDGGEKKPSTETRRSRFRVSKSSLVFSPEETRRTRFWKTPYVNRKYNDEIRSLLKTNEQEKKESASKFSFNLLRRLRNVYTIWKKKFTSDHCCTENEIGREILLALFPHVVLMVLLVIYVVGGAVIFQIIDEKIQVIQLWRVSLFTFTTIATIGYGDVVPTNDTSKLFCIFYALTGIPLMFMALSYVGRVISEAYWILLAALRGKKELDTEDSERLPLPFVLFLLLSHSVLGGILFHYWVDQMPIVAAIYFSFVSITTIGFGDLVPTPNDGMQTTVVILYLTVGMVIMSTLVSNLYCHLRRIHNIGRNVSGAANVKIWFGGHKLTVSQLIKLAADKFEVSPLMLFVFLRDLDSIIKSAPYAKQSYMNEMTLSASEVSDFGTFHKASVLMSNSDCESTQGYTGKNSVSKLLTTRQSEVQETSILSEAEQTNVLRAVGMLYHLSKTKSNLRDHKSHHFPSQRSSIAERNYLTVPY
ncbi:hypothetical protein AB6A40_006983 [Gnathostoma spinigerum]|uniref:Potassium channel domain-containing protein n=1 Tax=Gnathostoma spinigerum TaxID=75299 RepID=A0ABD6EQ29_9BILA